MAKLPRDAVKQYFPFYPDRWLTSRRLRVCSPAARGVLIDLMAMAWEDGGKVCEELDVLASSMGLSPDALQGLLDELTRRERITITNRKGLPPTIHVPPLEAIHAEAIAYIVARREDGKRGADARYKGAHRDPIGGLQGAYPLTGPELTGTDRTGSDQNIPEGKKGKSTFKGGLKGEIEEGFNQFWSAYPRKDGKAAAEKAWPKVSDCLPAILAALEWQRNLEGWTKEGGKYIPMPSTYLNGRRWEDAKPAPGSGRPFRRASQAVTTDGPGSTLEGVLKIVEG